MITRIIACAALLTGFGADASAADRPWHLIRGRNVSVAGQQSPRTLRRVAVEIEQFRMALGAIVPAARRPLPVPTIVYTFDDKKAMEPFVPLYLGKPASLGGYCQCGSNSEVNFIVANLGAFDDAAKLIYHEYTHLIIGNAIRNVPVWLSEGLAEYYSTFHLANDDRTAEIGRPIAYHLVALQARTIPIAELLAVNHSSALYNEGDRRSLFYAKAWLLTHYLMNARSGGGSKITAYLDAVGAGVASDEAFKKVFAVSPEEMDKELRSYMQRFTFPGFGFPLPARVEVDEPEKVMTLSAAEAGARLGGIQLRIGRIDEATARIEAAAAAGPDVAEAQLTLAMLRVRQDRVADMWTPLQKAASLAPDDFLTQYTYALILLRRHVNREEAPADSLEAAHAALARAVAANPGSSEALAWQAFADLVARTRLDEARATIARAIEISPGRLDFRLRLAEILLAQGEQTNGRAMLTALASAVGDSEIADRARSLLDDLNAAAAARMPRATKPAVEGATLEIELPAEPPRETDPGATLRLRRVLRGEERAYGMLTAVDCTPAQVRFHLAVGSRVIVATAPRLEDVQLTRFSAGTNEAFRCGPRQPPDAVYLTWRMARATTGQSAIVGTAVSVEFVPAGYVP